MARSIYCSLCSGEKEPERRNHGYCKTCHHKQRAEERAKFRAAKGLPAWGTGRNPHCRDCGIVKERRDATYCYACRNARQRAERKGEEISPDRVVFARCPCGAERVYKQSIYCKECKHKELEKVRQAEREAKRLSIEEVTKRKAEHRKWAMFQRAGRKFTETCINIGMLIRSPCEVCGDTNDVEAHHDDYYQPYQVRWLCRGHHVEHHAKVNDLKRRELE